MWDWLEKLEELRSQGKPAVLVTLIQTTGSTPREVGAKMIVLQDGSIYGTIGGGHLEELAIEDAKRCVEEGVSRVHRYPLGAKTGQCCGGVVELFMEVLNKGPRLYLFGAGHVGQAVCRTLAGTPFLVHVIDDRAEWINSPEIPSGVIRHQCEWDEFVSDAKWDAEKTYVVIMTHRHDMDQDIVEYVIGKSTRYVGLIGSTSKWERFRQRLAVKGIDPGALERVKCPIGLNIGGKAPQEVAVSLAAELLKVHYER